MPFVKLDTGILDSTLWIDRDSREVFITALLMAEPFELTEPAAQIAVRTLERTGFIVPPGWYGFVPAAGVGIVRRASIEQEAGLLAIERLGKPDEESRSKDFEGRRLVRIDGGYLVLNYFKYRDRDYTGAERQKRLRERRKGDPVTRDDRDVTRDDRDGTPENRDVTRYITHAEGRGHSAEAEVRNKNAPDGAVTHTGTSLKVDLDLTKQIRESYPAEHYRESQWQTAWEHVRKLVAGGVSPEVLVASVTAYRAQQEAEDNFGTKFVMTPANFFGPKGHWRGPFPVSKAKKLRSPLDRCTWDPVKAEAEEKAEAEAKAKAVAQGAP